MPVLAKFASEVYASLTLTAPRDMFLPPTPPTRHPPTLLIQTPKQLLPLILNYRGERARRTSLETGDLGLFELEGLFETMIQRERFGGQETGELGLWEGGGTTGRVHAGDVLDDC
jgi:hypothetical protein